MKKSITIIGSSVKEVFVIKNIDIDKVTLEKWSVECRSPIQDAWGSDPNNNENRIVEIKLLEKISDTTLHARGPIVEKASKLGGKIIKDFETERAKRGHKVYLSNLEFFNEQK